MIAGLSVQIFVIIRLWIFQIRTNRTIVMILCRPFSGLNIEVYVWQALVHIHIFCLFDIQFVTENE